MEVFNKNKIRDRNSSYCRWAAIGPYYAMFPLEFAYDVISKYSNKGDFIIDPFAGRGTSLYIGGLLGRCCDGIEINSVGWLYGRVKLHPALNKNDVLTRLKEIYDQSYQYKSAAEKMPSFYHYCYCPDVLSFLLSARDNLNWKKSTIDSTLMVIILLYLHNKIGQGLSNQMQLTKSMGYNYSISWWKKNNLETPPNVNPYDFIKSRIIWRYEKGVQRIQDANIFFGDSTGLLDKFILKRNNDFKRYDLLFTSPPYFSITNYHIDQWLRLWMLGGENEPKLSDHKYKKRFYSEECYYSLLDAVFSKSSEIMNKKSVIYVRTDARKITSEITKEILIKNFKNHKLKIIPRPLQKRTQTSFYNNNTPKPGEIDLVLIKE